MKDKVKFVDVLGKTYQIEYKGDFGCNNNLGAASRPYQRIVINKTISKEQQADTLLHEVVHIIDRELNMGLTEETVARLAVGLYSAGCRCKQRE